MSFLSRIGVGHRLFNARSLFTLGDRDRGLRDDPFLLLLLHRFGHVDLDGSVRLSLFLVKSGPVANVLSERSVRERSEIRRKLVLMS